MRTFIQTVTASLYTDDSQIYIRLNIPLKSIYPQNWTGIKINSLKPKTDYKLIWKVLIIR